MLFVLLLLTVAAPVFAQKPFDLDALLRLSRVSDPQVSPDGRTIAFTVQTVDVAANKKPSNIYIIPASGGAPVRITNAGESNERPRWSPDSRRIAFISDRSGSSQVWIMDADGGNPRQVTSLATEAGGVLYSRDGKNLVFTSDVYPECGADNACNTQRLEAEKNSKVKARIYTTLLYRHWTKWQTARRSHVLVTPVGGGEVKDLTPGNRDVPPFSLGGPDDYAISPDGTEVVYAMISDEVPAISTNSDLYVVPITGGDPVKITVNPAADNSPAYSPDGRIAPGPGARQQRDEVAVSRRHQGGSDACQPEEQLVGKLHVGHVGRRPFH
jgi:Tol biopolymer transport system component